MLSSNPNCFGHPTKVTFTFSEKCLKDESANYPPYASYWSGSPYRDSAAYNIQSWLSHKMKSQKEKLKLEKAVQRAERKLKLEYDRQMETKRQAAEQRFKKWLKSKGFADQSPVMLHRVPHRCNPDNVTTDNATPGTTVASDVRRPKTARVRATTDPPEGPNGRTTPNSKQRPRSASSNRRRITSTLDPKPPKPTPCKSLGQDDYMKMRHIAGKRYKKLKEEKTEFQCEDQLLRKLQDLHWEEKCIKSKMVYTQKEDLDKVKAKALKKRKKKLKFKGDLITVEVEEIDSQADLDITFEETDDKCSDIGCIEKEGVDFHIESRETIDLSDKSDDPICRPMTAEPPRLEYELKPTAPARPKSSKPRQKVRSEEGEKKSGERETVVKETVVKEKPSDSYTLVSNVSKNDEKSAKDSLSKDAKNLPKETTSPSKEKPAPPKEKPSPPKETTSPPKEKPSPPKETTSPPKEKPSPPKEVTFSPKETTSPPKEKLSPPKEATSPPKDKPSPPKEITSPPKEKPSPPKEITSPPKEKPFPPKEATSPPKEKASPPKGTTSPQKEATSPPKGTTSSPKGTTSPPKEKSSPPKETTSRPKEKPFPPKETTSPPKGTTSPPKEKPSPPKGTTSPPKEPAAGTNKKGQSEAVPQTDAKNSRGTVPNILVEVVENGNDTSDESSVDDIPKKETGKNNTTDKTSSSDANDRNSKIASDTFFD